MILPPLSIEQNEVIEQLKNNNVVVDSVAGSGKSTCGLYIALINKNANILQLTYNKKLKDETREKVVLLGLTNLEIHSYHSFCVKHYDSSCFTDSGIINILKNKLSCRKLFNYDIIILDEVQDMSSIYFELVCKIFKENGNGNTKICMFGDINQSIFDFNKADQRFITFAPELFILNNLLWKKCKLTTSFRITNQMSLFINNCMLKEDRIISNKLSQYKPRYIICDCFGGGDDDINGPFDEIIYYLKTGYSPKDIFIIAPSLRGSENSPVRKLENKIKIKLPHIPIYVPTNDDAKLDDEILEGKLVFSSIHQTKGLERKVIILFNFDNSYFEYFKKNKSPLICPNELYVATTRALEQLSVLHHYKNNYLPFLNKDLLNLYCDVKIYNKLTISKPKTEIEDENNIPTSVTDLIKHLPQEILDDCFNYFNFEIVKEKNIQINIPLKTKQNDGSEGVSELTGIAIPSYFEYKIKNNMGIFNELKEKKKENNLLPSTGCLLKIKSNKLSNTVLHKEYNLNNINLNELKTDELLFIANKWNTYKTGYLFKMFQITEYNWLSDENLQKCIERLYKLNISNKARFEYKCIVEDNEELCNRQLTGYFDCIDENKLYEFKCVQSLEKEHYLQLILYMYLNEMNEINNNNNLIQNIQFIDNEIIKEEEKLKLQKENPNNNKINDNKINKYNIGDKIKYNVFDKVDEGIIKKIYKNGKLTVENIKNKSKITFSPKIINNKNNNTIGILEEKVNQLRIKQKEFNENKNNININCRKYYLYNILTDEMIELKCEIINLIKIVELLIYNKYFNTNEITDEVFLLQNIKIRDSFL